MKQNTMDKDAGNSVKPSDNLNQKQGGQNQNSPLNSQDQQKRVNKDDENIVNSQGNDRAYPAGKGNGADKNYSSATNDKTADEKLNSGTKVNNLYNDEDVDESSPEIGDNPKKMKEQSPRMDAE